MCVAVQELRASWEGRLQPAVARVGTTFKRFFDTLGCKGEVPPQPLSPL
jgi:hypothetical protein